MKKLILWTFLLLAVPIAAQAQQTCTAVTNTTQNCLVTVTIAPGTVSKGQVAATSFQIRRSDGSGARAVIATVTSPVFQNTFTDAGGITHCYDAIGLATGANSSSPSTQQCWTSPEISVPSVATPEGITLSALSLNSLTLEWEDTPNETNYQVYGKRSTNQTYNLVATLPADTVSYNWRNRKRSTSYCMRVRAKMGQFIGDLSDSRCARTQ